MSEQDLLNVLDAIRLETGGEFDQLLLDGTNDSWLQMLVIEFY